MTAALFLLLKLLLKTSAVSATFRLQEVFSWSSLDYQFPSEFDRLQSLATRKFRPENNLPVGIEIWQDKVFVSVPRWRQGVPATLNYVPMGSAGKSPELIPYPDWESNELGNCEHGLTTVYRMKVDECDRLWVLDTGTFGIGNTTQNPCPYALNIFDLVSNRRLCRYELRAEDTTSSTFIANIAVEVGRDCSDAFAYLSDELGYGLIVYSYQENRSWRFQHGFFQPDPLRGDFTVDNLKFQWSEEGIFGIALTPSLDHGQRLLIFSPLASYRDFAVSTEILKNSSKVTDSYRDFLALSERGPKTHITSRVIDDTGVELMNLIDRNAIGCRRLSSETITIVDEDHTGLIFPSDIKIDSSKNVWVISDQMPTFLLSNLDQSKINFRIFFAPLQALVKGTACDVNRFPLDNF